MQLRISVMVVVVGLGGVACGEDPGGDGGAVFSQAPIVLGDGGGPGGNSISGQVSLVGAADNSGVQVTLQPWSAVQQTGADGSFFFDSIPAGPYTLTLGCPSYQPQTLAGTLLPGEAAEISARLERSLGVWTVSSAPDGGVLAYPVVPGADDGGAPGSLFLVTSTEVVEVVAGGASVRFVADAGVSLLGFDPDGDAMVVGADGVGDQTGYAVGRAGVRGVALPAQAGPVTLLDGRFAYGQWKGPGVVDWSALGPDDLSPIPLASGLRSAAFDGVPLGDALAGWTNAADGACYQPLLFGPSLLLQLPPCSSWLSPIVPSLDGQRVAIVSDEPGQFAEVTLAGKIVTTVTDSLVGGSTAVYPLGETAYLAVDPAADGELDLRIGTAPGSIELGEAVGWAPLNGEGAIMALASDGGYKLVDGSFAASIPFQHVWSQPIVSPSNRYVFFTGTASLFDFGAGVEIPLAATPVEAWFDSGEGRALILDDAGGLWIVPLGVTVRGAPAGNALEGTAVTASFTPDGKSVAYLGSDPLGNTGLFLQPLPASSE